MSFVAFYRRNLAFIRLSILSNIEYRFNFFLDALAQPALTAGIEFILWFALFKSGNFTQIGGFGLNNYLGYALWATFLARISTSWAYEHRMINDVEVGEINTYLVRPMSFFEYYLSQLFGYKIITSLGSLIFPIGLAMALGLPTHIERIPLAMLLIFYYLILVHMIGFFIASTAFFLSRVHHFSSAKNILLWVLMGELFPIDLMPDPWKTWLMQLPFVSGVYIPAGYITGRLDVDVVWGGFLSVSLSLLLLSLPTYALWKKGLRGYSGMSA